MKRILPPKMYDRLAYAAEIIKDASCVRIVSHHDADGVCSAAILIRTVMRLGHGFHTTLLKDFGEGFDRVRSEDFPVTVILDMGSGQMDVVEKMKGNIVVLDHHEIHHDSEEVVHINPRLYGINGTNEACASTIAFALSTIIDDNNWDLAHLFVAGCIGDKQDIGGLRGINRLMVAESKKRNTLEEKPGLKIRDCSIKDALKTSCDPYFLGISGDEDGANKFLEDIGIDGDKKIDEMSSAEIRVLRSALALKLLAQGVKNEAVEALNTHIYTSPYWRLSANEISARANACGRMDEEATALAMCLGDLSAEEKAGRIREEYINAVLKEMRNVVSNGPFTMKHIQFVYCDTPELSGTIAGLSMLYVFSQDMPTISLSVMEDKTKVSARGTKYLVGRGLNLAEACRDAAMHVGGYGGGHDIAAGATIPKGKEEEFLKKIDEIVGWQLGAEKA